jgi:hypothetical protein
MNRKAARAKELFRQYEADKLLVNADPPLTQAQREREITRLTDELEEAERAAGIRRVPLFRVEVEATGDGSVAV